MGSIPGCSIGELRSHMPHGKKSKQNRNYTAISIKANNDPHKKLKKKKTPSRQLVRIVF